MYILHLAKEPFKFSCSHFTILAPDRAERLHGHNYQVRVHLAVDKVDEKLGFAFDFNAIKPMIRKVCDELDERVLLPARSPYLTLQQSETEIDVMFNGKRYVFPLSDVVMLPLVNITSEELARHLCERLAADLKSIKPWKNLEVNVEETHGQSASYRFS